MGKSFKSDRDRQDEYQYREPAVKDKKRDQQRLNQQRNTKRDYKEVA